MSTTANISSVRALRDSFYPRCRVFFNDRADPGLIGFRYKGMIRWWRMIGDHMRPSGSTLRPGAADTYAVCDY